MNRSCFFLILFSLAVLVITWTISDLRLFSSALFKFCRLLSFCSNFFWFISSRACFANSLVFFNSRRRADFFWKSCLRPFVLFTVENLERKASQIKPQEKNIFRLGWMSIIPACLSIAILNIVCGKQNYHLPFSARFPKLSAFRFPFYYVFVRVSLLGRSNLVAVQMVVI